MTRKTTTKAMRRSPQTAQTTITAIAVFFGRAPIYSTPVAGSPSPSTKILPSEAERNPGSTLTDLPSIDHHWKTGLLDGESVISPVVISFF